MYATYDFSTLYTRLPHDKLIKRLSSVIDFVFEGVNRPHICISKNNVAHRRKKFTNNVAFRKSTLKTSVKHLILYKIYYYYTNIYYYFMVGNSLLAENRHLNGNRPSSILGKSLFIHA